MHGFENLTDGSLVRVLEGYQRLIDIKARGMVKANGEPTNRLAGWIARVREVQAARSV